MKKIMEFFLLCLLGLSIGYVVIMGMDKQAEINELKAEQWKVQRISERYVNKI